MPEDVDTLETKRSKLLEDFLSLGDLRPGSLTAVMRRCGKPSCHCAKRNDPGFQLATTRPGAIVFLRNDQEQKSQWHRFEAGRTE